MDKQMQAGAVHIFSIRNILDLGGIAARSRRRRIAVSVAVVGLISIPSLSSAAIYKCTAQDGSVTYTDMPCPVETTAQAVDPAQPLWLSEQPLGMGVTVAVPDGASQSQPEIIAMLCANDEFRVWLKAQRHSLPERDIRAAKFAQLNHLCRRALHLAEVAAPIAQGSPAPVLAQESPR